MSKRIELLDKGYILKELEDVESKIDHSCDNLFDAGYLSAVVGITALIKSMKPIKIVCPLCSSMEVEE